MTQQRIGQSRTPDGTEVIRAAMSALSGGLSVCMPGTIIVYNPATQTADVQPLLNRAVIGQDGTEDQEVLPIIPSVPVILPRGGGYYISFPILTGDNVLLVFADKSLDSFMSSAGNVPLDQVDLRQHHISDAVAIPGLYPLTKTVLDVLSPTDLVIGKEAGPTITISALQVDINGNFTVDL